MRQQTKQTADSTGVQQDRQAAVSATHVITAAATQPYCCQHNQQYNALHQPVCMTKPALGDLRGISSPVFMQAVMAAAAASLTAWRALPRAWVITGTISGMHTATVAGQRVAMACRTETAGNTRSRRVSTVCAGYALMNHHELPATISSMLAVVRNSAHAVRLASTHAPGTNPAVRTHPVNVHNNLSCAHTGAHYALMCVSPAPSCRHPRWSATSAPAWPRTEWAAQRTHRGGSSAPPGQPAQRRDSRICQKGSADTNNAAAHNPGTVAVSLANAGAAP